MCGDGSGKRKSSCSSTQELKGSEFPAAVFEELGYQSVAVTQKTYNGVAILSRAPIEISSKTLSGDELDSHARFLEVMIEGLRLVNIYLPNGNPIGSEKFAYKLAWMDRLALQMQAWLAIAVPTIVGGEFNVTPGAWTATNQPRGFTTHCFNLSRGPVTARCSAWDMSMHSVRSIRVKEANLLSGTTSGGPLNTTVAFVSTTFCFRRMLLNGCRNVTSTKAHGPKKNHRITRPSF